MTVIEAIREKVRNEKYVRLRRMPRLRHANGGETRQAGVLGQRKTHGDRGRACWRLPAVWGEGSQGRRWAVDCRACGKLKAAPKPPNDEYPGCQVRKERRLTIPLPRCPRSRASSRTRPHPRPPQHPVRNPARVTFGDTNTCFSLPLMDLLPTRARASGRRWPAVVTVWSQCP